MSRDVGLGDVYDAVMAVRDDVARLDERLAAHAALDGHPVGQRQLEQLRVTAARAGGVAAVVVGLLTLAGPPLLARALGL